MQNREKTKINKTPTPTASDSVINGRFNAVLDLNDKPDTKDFSPDLGSPISTLRPRAAASNTTTSSSSSSSGSLSVKVATPSAVRAVLPGRRSHSGELSGPGSGDTSPTAKNYTGAGSSASSPSNNALPAGNICPSGKILKTGMAARTFCRSDVLGSGTGNYGHGSIMRGVSASPLSSAVCNSGVFVSARSVDPHELTRVGSEHYKKGQFAEALRFYDQAVSMCPENAACLSNRAASLLGLGRLAEAMRDCEEVVRIDPANARAHQRIASISLRLGHIENARKHLYLTGQPAEPVEVQKVQEVERHLVRCESARKVGDWKSVLSEADAAIKLGADFSPMLAASRSEALLHLHQLDEADAALSNSAKFENSFPFFQSTKFFGMLSNSYFYIVRAQVDMALGRFENAVAAAEKAKQIDARSIEIAMLLNNVRSVARARAQGNELFKIGDFAEACTAYGEGLKYDPYNPVLLCNRAACRSKLGQWEKSVDDCNDALKIKPNYTKALLRRANSNAKLERWAEAVRDYEVLRKELPGDSEVAESLFHAQVALKTSCGEEVSNMKFGGEVEMVTSLEQFQAAISLPGASVVYFMASVNQQCCQIAPFVDVLCTRYPSANFLKVDINESPLVAQLENVRIVPTFKIYKNGARLKEMICPSHQVLEYSLRHYSL